MAIVDADSFSIITKQENHGNNNFRSWIENGHGVLAFCNSGRYWDEVCRRPAAFALFQQYQQKGKLKVFSEDEFVEAEKKINNQVFRSNDSHILALALLSKAEVLCSNDKGLKSDFTNTSILPRIKRRGRAVYPVKANKKTRQQFLDRRQCRNR